MNRTAFILCMTLAAIGAGPLQGQAPKRLVQLQEVSVTGKRPLTDVGTTKTNLDTLTLRETVVNSMADVLSQNTPIFIKSYGRGSLATASFRGTSPSHTQVLWNGLKLNSPTLGMVDFSMIPSFFIDRGSLYHGASSVGVSGGGLGGAVALDTKPTQGLDGIKLNFIQGISSFNTYDEFLRVQYGSPKFQSSTRFYYANAKNDFPYVNFNKRNEDGTYPTERNKNGSYRDLHLLQELYWQGRNNNKYGFTGWFLDSRRGVPMLNVNYREEDQSKNQQDETTVRLVGTWDRYNDLWKLSAKAGYSYSNMLYTYKGENGTEELVEMIHSLSRIHTGYAQFSADWYLSPKWMFKANASVNLNAVNSYDKYDKTGYDKQRAEASLFATAKYRPAKGLSFAADLRAESYGQHLTPLIPAFFAEYVLWPQAGLVVKASVARNFRYPSLNDLYFLPGGNDSLRCERGFTYDGGIETGFEAGRFTFRGEATVYNSKIKDWILWLPTAKGYWTPSNVKQVHSYGFELRGRLSVDLGRQWGIRFDGNWAKTRSINQGEPQSWADQSIGKQLVYIPEYSSSVTGRLSWKRFTLLYKYTHYSERYTTSSNDPGRLGVLKPYYMNDASLEKVFISRAGELSLKFSVYNLFNEKYVSVLSRPMPGRNYGFFLSITPHWKTRKTAPGSGSDSLTGTVSSR